MWADEMKVRLLHGDDIASLQVPIGDHVLAKHIVLPQLQTIDDEWKTAMRWVGEFDEV